jgi:D-alanine-D-alanine ligase
MKKQKKNIKVLRTENRPFSSMSKKSALMIQAVLLREYTHVEIVAIENLFDLKKMVEEKPDLVFLGLKRLPHEGDFNDKSIWVSEYLDSAGIAYTGSDKDAIELDFNKKDAKNKVEKAGLPTAPFFVATVGQYKDEKSLPVSFPLFVKPLNTGGKTGVDENSVVHDFVSFKNKVQSIDENQGSPALVEKYLTGREFSVAILERGAGRKHTIMPLEIIAQKNENGDRILGAGPRSDDTEQVQILSEGEAYDRVSALAYDVYGALGCRDFARIDIRMDRDGNPYFLEANLIPKLSGGVDAPMGSFFTRACRMYEGMSYENMIFHIAETGLRRVDL